MRWWARGCASFLILSTAGLATSRPSPSFTPRGRARIPLFLSPSPSPPKPNPRQWRHLSPTRAHTAAQTFAQIPRGNRRVAPAPHAAGFLRALFPSCPPLAKADPLRLIADQRRGFHTQSDPSRLADIVSCIDGLAASAPGADTVSDAVKLSDTWRLLWTTEREQLFIVRNAPAFRTAASDVLQVINAPGGALNNVISFPPSGAFVVNGSIKIQPPQRVNFRFTRAVLRGSNWEVPSPPLGKDGLTLYLDDDIRVAKDIRGDYLVVERSPYSRNG